MNIYDQLLESDLFNGFKVVEIESMLNNLKYKINKYTKDEMIAVEGEEIKAVGIVLTGEININKIHQNGKQMQVKQMSCGDLIGHALVFSDINCYSSTLIANTSTKILFIPNNNIVSLCMVNQLFLNNFLRLISNQVVYLSDKIKFITYSTMRRKIINYILQEYKKQKNLSIKLSVTRKKMAEILGVTRPALSNEMINMKKDRLIKYENNIIEILDINKLNRELH